MFSLLPLLGLVTSALATGYFTNPAGSDGTLTVRIGDTISISWTNITDYDVLSVGYLSESNQTITWLITNSNSQPTSYRWTVDAVAQGFNLADSSRFAFYACKDYNFGDPFVSSWFIISDDSASSSSTSANPISTASGTAALTSTNTATATSGLSSLITPSNTPTDTGTGATVSATGTTANSNSAVASSSSSDLSTGAKAGIAVGIIVGVLGFAAAAFMFFHQRKHKQRSATVLDGSKSHTLEAPSEMPSTPGVNYEKLHMGPGEQHKYVPYTDVHEAPDNSPGNGRTELAPGTDGQVRVELPNTNER